MSKGAIIFWVIVGLILLSLLFRSSGNSLCHDGEKPVTQFTCNEYDRPCPGSVKGCEEGCEYVVCYDKHGQATRQGWVKR